MKPGFCPVCTRLLVLMNLSGAPLRPLLPSVEFKITQQAKILLGGRMDDRQTEGEAVKSMTRPFLVKASWNPFCLGTANLVTLHYQTWILVLFPFLSHLMES